MQETALPVIQHATVKTVGLMDVAAIAGPVVPANFATMESAPFPAEMEHAKPTSLKTVAPALKIAASARKEQGVSRASNRHVAIAPAKRVCVKRMTSAVPQPGTVLVSSYVLMTAEAATTMMGVSRMFSQPSAVPTELVV